MATNLGDIFIDIHLNAKNIPNEISSVKKVVTDGVNDIEKTFIRSNSNVLKSQQALGAVMAREIELRGKLTRKYGEASNELNKYNDLISQGTPVQQAYNQAIERGIKVKETYGTMFKLISTQVLAAAPAFFVATQAINLVTTALGQVGQEFTRGLQSVEDYKVKVASMSAFLTTFDKALNTTNLAQVFAYSKENAQNLVLTMEMLDARTIATGKDLTTMAEQFIKGGVTIDTTNKQVLDGFVNIANATKLLTQGQNQEIQMRQEIRALTQGNVRDSNILMQTLSAIDPRIQEHIQLWKQQGTIIQNVGKLLYGFGPAVDDLNDTWAIVGSTMETIHNKVLRDAFVPTHQSLIKLAQDWNRALMDSNGNLTGLSKNIQSVIKGTMATVGFVTEYVWEIGKAVAIYGSIALGITAVKNGLIVINGLISIFNKLSNLNPFILLATATIYATKSVLDWREEVLKGRLELEKLNKEANKRSDSYLSDSWITMRAHGEQLSLGAAGENKATLEEYNKQLQERLDKQTKTNVELAEQEFLNGKVADSLKALEEGGWRVAAATLKESILSKARALDEQEQIKKKEQAQKDYWSTYQSIMSDFDKFDKDRYDMEVTLLNQKKSEYAKHFIDKDKLNKWYSNELDKIDKKYENYLNRDFVRVNALKEQKKEIESFVKIEEEYKNILTGLASGVDTLTSKYDKQIESVKKYNASLFENGLYLEHEVYQIDQVIGRLERLKAIDVDKVFREIYKKRENIMFDVSMRQVDIGEKGEKRKQERGEWLNPIDIFDSERIAENVSKMNEYNEIRMQMLTERFESERAKIKENAAIETDNFVLSEESKFAIQEEAYNVQLELEADFLSRKQELRDENIAREEEAARKLGEVWWNSAQQYIGFAEGMAKNAGKWFASDKEGRKKIQNQMLADFIRFSANMLAQYFYSKAQEQVVGAAATATELAMGAAKAGFYATYYGAHAVATGNPAYATAAGMMTTAVGLAGTGAKGSLMAAAGFAAAGIATQALGEALAIKIEGRDTGGGERTSGITSSSSSSFAPLSPALASTGATISREYKIYITNAYGDKDKIARDLLDSIRKAEKDRK